MWAVWVCCLLEVFIVHVPVKFSFLQSCCLFEKLKGGKFKGRSISELWLIHVQPWDGIHLQTTTAACFIWVLSGRWSQVKEHKRPARDKYSLKCKSSGKTFLQISSPEPMGAWLEEPIEEGRIHAASMVSVRMTINNLCFVRHKKKVCLLIYLLCFTCFVYFLALHFLSLGRGINFSFFIHIISDSISRHPSLKCDLVI